MTYLSERYCSNCNEYFKNCKLCPHCYNFLVEKANPNPKFEFTLKDIRELDSILLDEYDQISDELYLKIKNIINKHETNQ